MKTNEKIKETNKDGKKNYKTENKNKLSAPLIALLLLGGQERSAYTAVYCYRFHRDCLKPPQLALAVASIYTALIHQHDFFFFVHEQNGRMLRFG